MRFLVGICLLFGSNCLYGQGTTSRITGTVSDSTGAAVSAAQVTLTNEGTSATYRTESSESGTYAFEAVQSGTYTVTIEANGFRKFVSRKNPVAIGQPSTLNATLELGGVTELVEVTASAEAVQTSTSGNFGNLLPEKVIRDMPIVGTRGRNPLDLVLLQPGVVSGSNTGGGTHVNGARDRSWNFTLDGIDANETSAGGALFSPIRLNPDALAEMRVITSNATAETGRNSGAQVAMVTKSGTNEFHGRAFWFYRTPRLNANEWENNVNDRGQRQFVQNIAGGDLGGPVFRNKTFFYANLQVLRARESGLINRTVFTESARRGILRFVPGGRNQPAGVPSASVDASGNVLPGVPVDTYNVATSDPERIGLDPRVQGLVANTPLPNNFFGGDGLNTAFYTFTALQSERQHDVLTRVDHIFNERSAVFGRVNWGRQDTVCDRGNGGSELFPGRGCVVNTRRDPINMAYNWRWNPTPAVTNEFVVGRNSFTFDFDQPFANMEEYAFSSTISPSYALELTESTEFGNKRRIRTWQLVDNFAWQMNAHSLKFGTNLRWQSHRDTRGSIAGLNASPVVDFSTAINNVDPRAFGLPETLNTQFDQPGFAAWTNVLLGRVGNRRQGFVGEANGFRSGLYEFEALYDEYDFYIQDTWKARRNLTIDIGLRWEMKFSPDSPQGIRVPNAAIAAGTAASDTLRWVPGEMFKDRLMNLGPSLGFAWDPFSTGRTSVRGNYRIAYDRLPTFVASSFIFPNVPGATLAITDQEFGRTGGRLSNLRALAAPAQTPEALAQPASVSANSNTVFDPDLNIPTTHQWAFSIQREVLDRTVVEVSYIGRRAYHLFGGYNVNQPEVLRNGFVNEFNVVKNGGESAVINRLTSADARLRAGETGSQMYRRLFPADFSNNAVATLANRIGTQQQGGRLVTELSGAGNFPLIPYPQYGGGLFVVDSNDFSTYHGLQFQVERRLANGFTGQISYVLSKSLDTRSFDPVFTVASVGNVQAASSTPFDIYNRSLNYARSDFDRRHVVQSNFLYELPVGRGRRFGATINGVLDHVIGGWQTAGIVRWYSGRPFSVFSGSNTFNNGVNSFANCDGCTPDMGTLHDEAGILWWFTPEERAKFSAPAAGELGNTGRNFFNGPSLFNMDLSLLKRTSITERIGLELRADAINVTNTPAFGLPTTTFTSTTFGRIRDTVGSVSRKVQIGAKITF